MSRTQLPPFDPLTLSDGNRAIYPEPFASLQRKRFNGCLGEHAGLSNFGVGITHMASGKY